MGNPRFLRVLGVEVVLGCTAKTMAEVQTRGSRTLEELDFLASDLSLEARGAPASRAGSGRARPACAAQSLIRHANGRADGVDRGVATRPALAALNTAPSPTLTLL
jgi:hypothetical protein